MDYRIIDYIQGFYARKLSESEILALSDMLKDETLPGFKEKYSRSLTKKVEYFTPAKMKQLIDEHKEIRTWLSNSNIQDLNELYEN